VIGASVLGGELVATVAVRGTTQAFPVEFSDPATACVLGERYRLQVLRVAAAAVRAVIATPAGWIMRMAQMIYVESVRYGADRRLICKPMPVDDPAATRIKGCISAAARTFSWPARAEFRAFSRDRARSSLVNLRPEAHLCRATHVATLCHVGLSHQIGHAPGPFQRVRGSFVYVF
jgi:hypothetical protein